MTIHRLAPFLALALVLSACSGSGGAGAGAGGSGGASGSAGTDAGSAPTSADLEGRTFLSTSVEGHELAPDSRIRIRFDGAGLSVSAGCNTIGGPFTLEGGTLTTGALMSTEMACPEPLMAQDTWLAGFLKEATVDLSGDTLILGAGDARIVLGDEQALVPDRPIEGTNWILDTILTGDAASSVPAGIEASLLFSDGQLAMATGCNRGSGQVEVRDATIVLGPVMSTKMACDEERGALESTIFGLLTGEVPYAIDGDRLTLGSAPNQLVYRAGE